MPTGEPSGDPEGGEQKFNFRNPPEARDGEGGGVEWDLKISGKSGKLERLGKPRSRGTEDPLAQRGTF